MNINRISDPEFKKEIASNENLKLFPAGTVILDINSYINYIPLVGSCSEEKKSAQNTDAAILVTVSNTTAGPEGSSATASGKLVARNSVNVSTRMMGYII